MEGKSRVCPSGQNQLQDSSESESEPEGGSARTAGTGAPCAAGSFHRSQVIHSGHFMVSSPHSDAAPRRRRSGQRYDFDTVNRTWCQTYRYGPFSSGSLSIDPTLTRLFECMSLAYSGKIVSPKWKSFKGLRLLWRDKIRLNNAIWRAWFIQYVEKRKNSVCGFVTPLEGSEADAHRKPEAIVLEGSYWKRRIEVVIKEYHKWRIYYKKRLQKKKDDFLSMLQEGPICQARLEKWSNQMYQEPEAVPVEAHMFDLDCLLSDISDTLFTMTQKPCPWASGRHNIYTTNADVIQPGLTPLQPNLDDFMDIPDIFMNYRGQPSEGTSFTDCGYFQSSPSAPFGAVPSTVVTTPQLLIGTQAQPSLSSGSLSQLVSSTAQSDQPRCSQDCSEYQTSSVMSGTMAYGHSSYPDPYVSVAFTSSTEQPVAPNIPFLYPPPCHKFGNYTTTSVTSTVITHTASTLAMQGTVHQTHSYAHTGDTYTQAPCPSLSYPAAASDLTHTASAPVTAAHFFSVPEHVVVTGVRGKHKQKMKGARTVGSTVAPSAPMPTSCLAKLLSSTVHERKPSLGFDSTVVTAKGQRSLSPSFSRSSSSTHVGDPSPLQQGAAWTAGMPVPMPLQSHTESPAHSGPHSSKSRGSALSALLSHRPVHTSTTPLIPKTEKLSPVHLYSTDRAGLTVSFSAQSGQTSPLNPEKISNPESPRAGFSGHVSNSQESNKQTDTRRITHISAEQKRRFNIKLGFDTLHNLVTTLSSQPSIKISKATTLQKTAEYISKMQQERAQLHEEAQRLREEIKSLNSSINVCQQQLPATGVPITRQRFDHMRQRFRDYVQAQTLQNWKFWIFSIIIEPLFESYNGMVSTASVEDLCRSTLSWLDQHCSLPALRPMVLSSLRLLSTTTSILTDPSLLPEQATLAVSHGDPPPAFDHSLQPVNQDNVHPM
ncbi:carbohydrate-responsive element-binding protein-like isoform X2 [Thalassophryne amazonica]|uniref:carbohydrate-responsive element-binding protein-like isoform X2 n=1 Tax=Thalassophryne amazonica TaxID=390379 RepID=UPI001471787A|nr:carbohydrate-responsive element-binding protein-like isoform X2 [Thalassophryne amazonica]